MRLMQVMLLLTLWVLGGQLTYATEGNGLSQGSALSVEGISTLAEGSVEVITASSTLTLEAINAAANGANVVLKGASTAATVSVEVTPEMAGYLAGAIGATVAVVAESSGYALICAGRMIAFVPNEISRGLVHHAPHRP